MSAAPAPRVLAVDDEKLILMSLSLALQREGYVVDTASSGSEACQMIHATHYDLILTDLRLPDISGFEVLRYARRLDACAKVILVTASSNAPSPAEAERAGACGVVLKPFTLSGLAEQARRAISGAPVAAGPATPPAPNSHPV